MNKINKNPSFMEFSVQREFICLFINEIWIQYLFKIWVQYFL